MIASTIVSCSPREAPSTARSTSGPRATVELDVFSGRPNPTWTLSETDRKTLEAMLQSLPPAQTPVQENTLGYRGFVVGLANDAGAVTTVRVFKGAVQQGTGDSAKYLGDPEKKIEAWLLSTGRSTLSPETYQQVQKEVTSNGEQR